MLWDRRFLIAVTISSFTVSGMCDEMLLEKQERNTSTLKVGRNEAENVTRLEIYDGVFMDLPIGKQDSSSVVSFQVDMNKGVEGRGKNKKMMERILPMFIIPFLVQSAIIPMLLSSLKFMLFKAMMVGKLALTLLIVNAFRNSNAFKGRYDKILADQHYGYHGTMQEYGALVN